MRKRLIVANWKMQPGSAAEARLLFGKLKRSGSKQGNVETVICPPFPYLGLFAHAGTTRVSLGAQDAFWQNSARVTGAVAPEVLHDLGVAYVIVGHSERRALGETDEETAKKTAAVIKEGMQAILCIGERERDADGRYFDFLKHELRSSLSGIQRRQLTDLIIAYEPIFTIGKSARDALNPRDIREMSIFIRKVLSDMYEPDVAAAVPILYGGSAEEANTPAILLEGGVAGLLGGHASLDAEGFGKMLKTANAL